MSEDDYYHLKRQKNDITLLCNKYLSMKTILVPVDFSEAAKSALNVAKAIAVKSKATIHLANFYSIPVADYSYPDISMPAEIMEQIKIAAQKGMEVWCSELKEAGIDSASTVKMGLATDGIIDLADELNADLIVMGTTGASGLLNKVIGSNASHVMQRSEKPIILVPKDSTFFDLSHIAYADSLEDDDTPVLKQLFEFAELVGAEKINIVNINTSNHYEPVNKGLYTAINETFGYERIKWDFLEADSLKDGFDAYLETHNIDLVAMSTQKKTLLERIFSKSNTRMMALYSKVPLLVFHKKAN
jgi:nucleotide-binding universal stress UspA family protein